jgi:hypothetical protein
MTGFNSDVPSLFVSSATGTGTTGNVGIGGSGYSALTTPSPLEKLEVWNGNISQTNVDLFANTAASSANSSTNLLGLSPGTCPVFGLTTNNLGTTNTIPGIANSFVQVGVDATGPAVKWDVNSILSFNIDANTTSCSQTTLMEVGDNLSGAYSMILYGTGFASMGTWQNSDIRFKSNISDIENPFDVIMKLNGKSYSYKKNEFPKFRFDDRKSFGFIAQELKEVLPEAVNFGPDSFLAVNYSLLIPYLCEGLKIHHNEIEMLKKGDEIIGESKSIIDINAALLDSINQANQVKMDSLIMITQYQDKRIDSLSNLITTQFQDLNELKSQLQSILTCLSGKKICDVKSSENINLNQSPFLGQNIPNPFKNLTKIPYFIPSGFFNARIEVFNTSGVLVKAYKDLSGYGEVDFEYLETNGSTFYYRLVIDEKPINTLKMLRIAE